ncbi:hypothetical protein QYF36_001416 [Acer negundo]|nr:hypothetical protein QYF36_001416 [Acer negundo]
MVSCVFHSSERLIVTMDDDMPSTNKKKRKDCIERNGKIVVESILDGIPYGPGANALLKDLGKLARKIIPLTVNDWRKEDLRKKYESGTLSFEGDKDILTTALGSKEHDGRVRGMRKFVTPSNYFHTPNPQAQWNKEKKALESRIAYLEERMKAFLQRSVPDKTQTHFESHVEAHSLRLQ